MAKVVPHKILCKANHQIVIVHSPEQIKLDQEQLDEFGENLSHMLDGYADQFPRASVIPEEHAEYSRTSNIIRWFLIALFIGLGGWLIGDVIIHWDKVITNPFSLPALLAGMTILVFGGLCFGIAADIKKERSKSYIISLFSAVVAVVALIVTLTR